jgi:hypothetical protein
MSGLETLQQGNVDYYKNLEHGQPSIQDGSSDDDDNDPYSNKGIKDAIMQLIAQIMANLKAGRDVSADMNRLLEMMMGFGANVVGQDSEAQKQMTKYLSGVADIQQYINDKDGKPVQDIDPYSGEAEENSDGTKKMVSPEEALQHQLQYLINDPKTKYKVEDDGTGHPKLVEPKTINQSYEFYKKHPEVYDSQKSNIMNLLSALKNKDGTSPSFDSNTAGYNFLSDGTINPGQNITPGSFPYDNTPNQSSYPGGAIEYMWTQDSLPIDPSTGEKPDPTILNQVMSAIGSINQSYTSASSALQTVAQADVQAFNAEQGILNQFLQAQISFDKVLVQGEKPN